MRWTIDALRNNSPDINDSYMSLEQLEADHDGAVPLAAFRRQLLNMEGRVLINVHDLPSAEAWQGLDERLFARSGLAQLADDLRASRRTRCDGVDVLLHAVI